MTAERLGRLGSAFRVTLAASAIALHPMLARAQGDSFPTVVRLERVVDSLRAGGLPIAFNRFFRWVERVTVIDMIPQQQSNETNTDAEPNLAVDPSNPTRLVGSAFTPDPNGAVNVAPVFVSTDGGNTWALRSIVPSANGMTGDISLDFAPRGNTLYTGILRGGGGLRQVILRTGDPFAGGTMTTLIDHSTDSRDQPYVSATTTNVLGTDRDRVYVGFNFWGRRISLGGNGRTAAAEYSLDARTAAPPAGFTTEIIEERTTIQQDMPATRFAVHSRGMIYGVFYRWTSGAFPRPTCDVIVVRDNSFATSATPFTALTDPSDGVAGRIVATGRVVPAFGASLGQNRLVASNLSIAVHPNNAATVYIAWADSDATSRYTLHLRRSTDSGATWSLDLLTIANATNPALAINSDAVVGYLYQQLTGTAPNQRWETHLRRSTTGTAWSDMVLANTPDNNPLAGAFQPHLGDYIDLIAVGRTFTGIFSASNIPSPANFPQGVRFQRNVNFATTQLRNIGNTANVSVSIDPFFFKVEPPTILDICWIAPRFCPPVEIEPGALIVPVDTFPVRVFDPIPKNCLVKWNCPGCRGALCPGYYHIFIDEMDPAIWRVEILGRQGERVAQQLTRTANGIVLSFRPSPRNFREAEIGDYYLTLETVGQVPRGRHRFATRLEVSEFPQREHLRQKR